MGSLLEGEVRICPSAKLFTHLYWLKRVHPAVEDLEGSDHGRKRIERVRWRYIERAIQSRFSV